MVREKSLRELEFDNSDGVDRRIIKNLTAMIRNFRNKTNNGLSLPEAL